MNGCTGDLAKMICLYIVLPLLFLIACAFCLPCKLMRCIAAVAKKNLRRMEEEDKKEEDEKKEEVENKE